MNERIKYVRAERGLTQEQFANKIGLTRNYVARIEIGERTPSDRTISDICEKFGVNEKWLRTGIGEPLEPVSRSDEIAAFVGKLVNDGSPIQQAFITVLARTTPDEWALFESKLLELAAEVKNIKKETDQ